MKNVLRLLCISALGALLINNSAMADIPVTVSGTAVTNPALAGSYPTLTSALAALNSVNSYSTPGTIVLTCTGGNLETAPAKGLTLGSLTLNPLLSPTNTITINTDGGTVTINAGAGTGTPGSASPDGILKIVGADYVTIDGLTLNDGNTSNNFTMEYGIGLFKFSAADGAQHNTIQNCTINMQRVNNAGGAGPMVDGSTGILMVNSVPTAATTALAPSTAAGSNSYNAFYHNTINSGNNGMALIGYAGASPFAACDFGNDVGGTAAGTGNSILNYGGATNASNPSAGIRTLHQYDLNISHNVINNNDGGGVNHVSTLRGIFLNTALSASATVSYNNVSVHGGGLNSQVALIENASGSTAAGNTINIHHNTLTGSYLTATTGLMYGIYNSASPSTLYLNNNVISGITYSNSTLVGSGVVYAIFSSGAAASVSANLNEIYNITRTGTTGANLIGIYISNGTSQNVSNNTVHDLTLSGTGAAGALYGIQTSSGAITVTGNTIYNLSNSKTTGTGALYGIYNIASPTSESITNNGISNLTHSGTGTTYGIYLFTTNGAVMRILKENTVFGIQSSGLAVAGISSSGSSSNIHKNKIYDIQSNSTGNAIVSGLILGNLGANGSANVYNNIIGDLKSVAGGIVSVAAPAVRGINITASSGANTSFNLYYNTVRLSAGSTAANFGSAGIYAVGSSTATTAALTLNNNIIVNHSVPSGSGYTVAFHRSGTDLANFGAASDYNLFHAGAPGIARHILYDGTNAYTILNEYKTAVFPREAASVSAIPNWLSTTGSDASYLHIDGTIPSAIESGGVSIPTYAEDFEGDVRQGDPGYPGTGTAPDLGADEFEGLPLPNCSGIPAASTITGPSFLCYGTGTTLGLSQEYTDKGISYQWQYSTVAGGPYTNLGTASTQPTGNLTQTTYYVCQITCSFSSSTFPTPELMVLVPTVSVTPLSATYCTPGGPAIHLTASGMLTYAWSPAAGLSATSGAEVDANPTANTEYTVTGTDGNGCTSVATTSITVGATVTISSITATPPSVCPGGTSTLQVNAYTGPAEYCQSLHASGCSGDNMAHIVLNTLNSYASACDLSTSTPPRYLHVTAVGDSTTTLSASGNYTLSVTFGPDANQYFGAWIDFNRDGSFAPGEFIGASGNAGSNGTVSVSFTVPAGVVNGVTRLRIVGGNDVAVLSNQACGASSFGWGETQDYDVTLTGGIAPYTYLWSENPASGTLTGTTSNPVTANGITVPETYSVTITSPMGCPATGNVAVGVFTPVVCTGISYETPCRYTNFNVTANTTGGGIDMHYAWSDPFNNTYPDAKTVVANLPAGTYALTVTVTDECGTSCTMSQPINIGVYPGGNIYGPATGVTYQGAIYTLVDYAPGSTFQWEVSGTGCADGFSALPGAQSDVLNWVPTAAGTFYLHCLITGSNGCQSVSNCLTVTVSGQGDNVCTALPLSFGLNGPYTNSGMTTEPGEPVPPATGCETQTGWCTSNISNTVWFTFTAPPSGRVSIGNNPLYNLWNNQFALYTVTSCNDFNTFTLVAANDDSTQSAAPYKAFIAPLCLVPGQTYYLQVDGFETTVNLSWGIRLTDEGNAAPVIAGCPSNIVVPANAAGCTANVNWTAPTASDPDECFLPLTFVSNYNPGDNFPLGVTTVFYTADDHYNTSVTCSFTVTVESSAVPVIAGDLSICEGSSNVLDAGEFVSYIWSTAETTRTIEVSTAGTFSVTVTDVNGCTGTASVTTVVNPLPAAVAGTDRVICLNDNTRIGAEPVTGNTYSWTSVPAGFTSTEANPLVAPLETTTYTLVETVTETECTNTHSVTVTVNPLPQANTGADRAICLNESTQLGAEAVPGNTYSWISVPAGFTSTESNPTVSPTETTTYTLTETITATGCFLSHDVTVTVNPLPAAEAGIDRAICLNESTLLGAAAVPGNTYSWTSVPAGFISTEANPTVSPSETTVYTVIETITETGCNNTHSVTVTVNPLPGAIAGSDRAICLNESTQIGAAAVAGNTYSWTSVPEGFTSTEANPTVSPTETTVYTLVETITETGCNNTHSVTVTVNPLPEANAGTDRAICLEESTGLGAPAVTGNSYSWTSVPAGFLSAEANPVVSPMETTVYTLTETVDATGCTNTHSVTVTVNPLPTNNLPVSVESSPICPGTGTNFIVENSEIGVNYQLIYYYNSAPAGSPVAGNGGTIYLPTPTLTESTDFAVTATIALTGCWIELNHSDLRVLVGGPQSDLAEVHVCNGATTVDIPVTVASFTEVGSLSLSFGYNTAELTNPTVISRNAVFEGEWDPFLETTFPDGLFRVSGYGALQGDEVSIPDGGTLFTLRFNIVSGTTFSEVSFIENTQGTGLEYTLGAPDYIPFCDVPTSSYYFTGSVTVNPIAIVDDPANPVICNGDHFPGLTFTSTPAGNYTYSWTNDTPGIGLAVSGTGNLPEFDAVNTGLAPVVATLTVTPTLVEGGVSCVGDPQSFTITVNPSGHVTDPTDVVMCNDGYLSVDFSSDNTGGVTSYQWTNDNPSIGLPPSGTGNIGPFLTQNTTTGLNVATIIVTPNFENGGNPCPGTPETFTITVNPDGQVDDPMDVEVCNGGSVSVPLTTLNAGGTTTYTWTNNNTTIGLPESGSGDLIQFVATNSGLGPVFADVTVIPHFTYGGVTCDGQPVTFSITVYPSGHVNDPSDLVYCDFESVPPILFTSNNTGGETTFSWTNDHPEIGLDASGDGVINPFIAYNAGSNPIVATITVTPTFNYPGGDEVGIHCTGNPETFTITVNPAGQVNSPGDLYYCNGDPASVTFATNNGGGVTTYAWTNDNTSIGLASGGTGDIPLFSATNTGLAPVTANLTVTATYENDGKSCVGTPVNFTITVNPAAQVNPVSNIIYCNGETTVPTGFTTLSSGGITTYSWTNDNTSIGLEGSGSGEIPIFTAINTGLTPVVANLTVTPHFENGGITCDGPPELFTITVNPSGHVNDPADVVFCPGNSVSVDFTSNNGGGVTTYQWTNDNITIGLDGSGTGNIGPFTAINPGLGPEVATIVVTPYFDNGGTACAGTPETFTITVNPAGHVYATNNQEVCNGGGVFLMFASGNTGGSTSFTWTNDNPSIGLSGNGSGDLINFAATNSGYSPITGNITVTPSFTNLGVTCEGSPMTFSITVFPSGHVNDPTDLVVCNTGTTPAVTFTTNNTGGQTTYAWTNDHPEIGLAASGNGNIDPFIAINTGTGPVVATITVTPTFNYPVEGDNGGIHCTGNPETFTITVNPTGQVNNPGDLTVCNGANASVTFTTLNSGGTTTYEWYCDNPAIGLAGSGSGDISFTATNPGTAPIWASIAVTPTYEFSGTSCTGNTEYFFIFVNPTGQVNSPYDVFYCNGDVTAEYGFSTMNTVGTTTYTWTNDHPEIGLPATGSGPIPSFVAVNSQNYPIMATIVVTPHFEYHGVVCDGPSDDMLIVVNPTAGVLQPASQVACTGDMYPGTTFATSNTSGTVTYEWVNDNPSIGLVASGTGDIPPFIATNLVNHPIIGIITVTPTFTYMDHSCTGPAKQFTITVNPLGQVDPVTDVVVCNGVAVNETQFLTINTGGTTTYEWTNDHPEIGLAASGTGFVPGFSAVNIGVEPIVATITVIPTFEKKAVYCVGPPMTYTITVNPSAMVDDPGDVFDCAGNYTDEVVFTSPNTGGTVTYTWTNDQTSIGLAASGTGNIASFLAINGGTSPVTANITVTAHFENGMITCEGLSETFSITINPVGQVDQPANQVLCRGDNTAEVIFTTQNSGGTTRYEWTNDNPDVNLPMSGVGNIPSSEVWNDGLAPEVATITVTPVFENGDTDCYGTPVSFTITVNPFPIMDNPYYQEVCDGAYTQPVNFTSGNSGGVMTYSWTNSEPSIGIPASGEGDLPSFMAINTGTEPIYAGIVVTPHFTNGGVTCDGEPEYYFEIKVNPSGQVNQPDDIVACVEENVYVGFNTNNTGGLTTYYWINDNTDIGLGGSGTSDYLAFAAENPYNYPITATITVTPVYGIWQPVKPPFQGCTGPSKTFTITVNPTAQVDDPGDFVYGNSDVTDPIVFTTQNTGGTTVFTWYNDTPGIGLASGGSGDIPSFTAVNMTLDPIVATIEVSPEFTYGDVTCYGPSEYFTITVNPKPILVITNPSVCSPNKVNLTLPSVTAGSYLPAGTELSYWKDASASIPVPNPAAVSNGTYYIKATILPDGWFDIEPVTAVVSPLPTIYSGVGSGTYCGAVPSITVGISGSQVGVNYWLYSGIVQISPTPIAGTGGPILFDPVPPVAGVYWVLAQNATTTCMNYMYNCISISIITPLPVGVSIVASQNPVPADQPVTFTATPSNGGSTPVYQWKVNGYNVGSNSPAFVYQPVNGDEVTCVLTSSEACVTGNPATSNTIVMDVTGVPGGNITVTGQVTGYDSKCYNALGTITVAGSGTAFVVNSGSSAVFIAGQSIIFKPDTRVLAGGYMRGYISTTDHCGVKAPAIPAVVAAVEETPVDASRITFRIYPNPTSGTFTLEQTGGEIRNNVKVEIYGMRGDKVLSGQMSGEIKHEFSVAGFPAGLYFVKIVAGSDAETIKLIKTN